MSCNKLSLTNSTSARWKEKGNNNAVVRTYTWGLDIRESSQGAGGVAGLLMVNAGSGGIHFPAYDLNGNVMGLVKAANGTISTRYEYGPFGEVFCSVGELAGENPFQFSTKYTDFETDLVYYGYRYYSPDIGRWISRDPIEEQGGFNLYAFVNNDPVNHWDMLGLECTVKKNAQREEIIDIDSSRSPNGWECTLKLSTLNELNMSNSLSFNLKCKLHVIVECECGSCLVKRKGTKYVKKDIGVSNCNTSLVENRFVSPLPFFYIPTTPRITDVLAKILHEEIMKKNPFLKADALMEDFKKDVSEQLPKSIQDGEWLKGKHPCDRELSLWERIFG